MIHDEPTDLILLGIELPIKDGLDTLRHFNDLFGAPVFFITAPTARIGQNLGLELGALPI